ncbi:MAG: ABC transporter permease [Proteobacteria bacterium]|nr:ABC transporter permease [Pseudomonadota bacterium]
MREFLARFVHNRIAAAGLMTVAIIIATGLLAPILTPFDPMSQNIMQRLLPPLSQSDEGLHLFGTDALGRDLLSRLIIGSRISLLVGAASVILSGGIGVTFGLIAGYDDRRAGRVLMAITDIQLAIPFLILALAVVAVLGPGLLNLILVLGVTNWVQYARLIRAECLVLRHREFVEAAEALGASDLWIIGKHLLPNVTASIIVVSSLQIAKMILFESSLSFLGLGVPPSIPTWGSMIADGRNYISTAWWVAALPGLAIFITVVGINVVGDRLRDLMDPRLKQLEI